MMFTLKQARQLKGFTQEDLARTIGKHVQTYRKMERDPDYITIGDAKKICRLLDMNYDLIFFSSDSTFGRETNDMHAS